MYICAIVTTSALFANGLTSARADLPIVHLRNGDLAATRLLSTNEIPRCANFFLLSKPSYQPPNPTLPPPCRDSDAPVYATARTNVFIVDDRNVSYPDYSTLSSLSRSEGPDTPTPSGPVDFGTNLWVEVIGVDTDNHMISIAAHNTREGYWYQLQFRTELSTDASWTPGEILQQSAGTNELVFSAVPMAFPAMFFRAQETTNGLVIRAEKFQNAAEACGTNDAVVGSFRIYAAQNFAPCSVPYRLSGSATMGQDYTNLSGVVALTVDNAGSAYVFIDPLAHTNIEFTEDVVLTLVPGPGYFIDRAAASATLDLYDCLPTNLFTVVATNLTQVSSIDYHAPTTSLVVGLNIADGYPYDFALLNTNNVLTQWSGVQYLRDEVKFATVKATTNGFTNGDMYFGTYYHVIGWLSADGTVSNLNWCTLSNETDQVKGYVYVDQTGIWGHDLLAVTGEGSPLQFGTTRGVWRIDSQANAQLVTRFEAWHLEGILTLANDSRYGPLAGKLITADEDRLVIYAIDTNGVAEAFYLNVSCDDIHLIPADQDLYCAAWPDSILKVSKSYFTNYVGDLLFVQSGENSDDFVPKLIIVHWDAARGAFTKRSIDLYAYFPGYYHFEHVTFAPINIPDL